MVAGTFKEIVTGEQPALLPQDGRHKLVGLAVEVVTSFVRLRIHIGVVQCFRQCSFWARISRQSMRWGSAFLYLVSSYSTGQSISGSKQQMLTRVTRHTPRQPTGHAIASSMAARQAHLACRDRASPTAAVVAQLSHHCLIACSPHVQQLHFANQAPTHHAIRRNIWRFQKKTDQGLPRRPSMARSSSGPPRL